MKVLVADDQKANRKLLSAILEAEGFEIVSAVDGKEALDILKREKVDVIISDILMPRVDGYRLCYEVRNDSNLQDIPIIIHSASYTSASDRKLALEFGADRFIKKSSPAREMLAAVMEVTSADYRRSTKPSLSTGDLQMLKQYSERLIEKLEERNIQLEGTKEMLTVANQELFHRTEDLTASEEKFRDIIEHVQDVFFRASYTGDIEMISPSIERYGYNKHELVGTNIRRLCATARDARKFLTELVLEHAVNDFEIVLKRKDGGTFVASVNARQLRDPFGIAGLDGFVRDITERKRTEEILRERSLLATLGADIGQALVQTETMGEMLSKCCDSFVADLGAVAAAIWTVNTTGEMLELQAVSGAHGGMDQVCTRIKFGHLAIGTVAAKRAPMLINRVIGDARINRQDWAREEGVVAFAGFPLIISDRLLGVAALFTRKEVSELTIEGLTSAVNMIALGIDRKLDEEALRKAEEKYRSIFENSAEGIFQTLPSGQIITANPTLARILGYDSPAELIATGRNISSHCVYPGDREHMMAQMEEHGLVPGVEIEFHRKDGTKIWALTRSRAVKGTDGKLMYYEGSLEEVTERKHLHEQLIHAQKMEAVGRLAGGVAHDFNNLLTAIIGYASLALAKIEGQESIRHDIEEIEKAGRRASSLTNQLLVFSRRQVVQPRILDLNTVVKGVESMLRRLIGEDIDLSTDLAPDTGAIKADPGQIEQIVLNLAVNARDAMPDGGRLKIETRNIEFSEATELPDPSLNIGPYTLLSVRDTGMGMDKKTQSRIFEPFFTTKEVGKGTGLGLSTVYGVAQQTGGYIEVESELGIGTVFTLYIPRIERSAEAASAAGQTNLYVRGSETIMVIEDDESVRVLAKMALENTGYTVLVAEGAEEALKISERYNGRIHLAITDIVMPGGYGPKLAEILMTRRQELKMLFMSGYTDDSLARLKLGAGAPFLQKPFTPIKLAQKVREILDQPRMAAHS